MHGAAGVATGEIASKEEIAGAGTPPFLTWFPWHNTLEFIV